MSGEYIAAVVSTCIAPCNWMAAAYICQTGVEGAVIISPEGNQTHAHEYVTPTRQFALILQAAAVRGHNNNPLAARLQKEYTESDGE